MTKLSFQLTKALPWLDPCLPCRFHPEEWRRDSKLDFLLVPQPFRVASTTLGVPSWHQLEEAMQCRQTVFLFGLDENPEVEVSSL